jgi:enterobacteria phage integrase
MTRIKLRYVDYFTDRNGYARYYFRRRRGSRITLPGMPGSAEFMQAYEAALANQSSSSATPQKSRGTPGTFDHLVELYLRSSDYARLAPSTRNAYRLAIDRLIRDERIGHRRVDQLRREHVSHMLAKRAETPGAANDALKKMRILVRFAIDNGLRKDDPTLRLKPFAEGELHTWSDEEIARYETRWKAGTRERTSFALLLFTGQRLADVARMSWRDLEGGGIHVLQGKTRERLWIPLHPDLAIILEQWTRTHLSILVTNFGKPFTTKGFGNWMADRIALAGLPERCVTHGLRKAAARRLADAGCTPHQIMSITGHRSLKEVTRYTRATEQRRLATDAMERLKHKNSQP